MRTIPDPKKMKQIEGPHLGKRELDTAKIRITTYIDGDILSMLRQLAKNSGSKYQAILNQILRNTLLGEEEGIVARIARLEKAVFKSRAA